MHTRYGGESGPPRFDSPLARNRSQAWLGPSPVTFKETPASYPEYTATIEKFEKKIKALGEKARLKDMFYTALAWATFSHYDYDTDMGIKLIADVDTLFGNW